MPAATDIVPNLVNHLTATQVVLRRRAARRQQVRRLSEPNSVLPLLFRRRFTGRAPGVYRVASPGIANWMVWIGVDAPPDLEGAAEFVTATLPVDTDPLDPEHVYQLVVRYRNAWGLVSQNATPYVLRVDAGGDQESIPPSNPSDVNAAAAAAGTILITARYNYLADGESLAADAFLIFISSSLGGGGVDPDPGVDTPVEVAMTKSDGVARLSYTTSAYLEGTEIRVIVRTRRSGTPDVDSSNVVVHTAIATYYGPAAPSPAGIFVGGQAEQI